MSTTAPAVPTCIWIGASGTKYTYHIHELPVTFSPNQLGNYIYAKLVDSKWAPIYVGEGDLRDRVSANHHKAKCIADNGATHVHEHLNPVDETRKNEETDLLARYTNAYSPFGCNEKLGG